MAGSELGELYAAWDEHKKEKKQNNQKSSVAILEEKGVKFERLSDTHLRVAEYDYWPSTGLFIHRKTQKRGRGVFGLLKKLGVQ